MNICHLNDTEEIKPHSRQMVLIVLANLMASKSRAFLVGDSISLACLSRVRNRKRLLIIQGAIIGRHLMGANCGSHGQAFIIARVDLFPASE